MKKGPQKIEYSFYSCSGCEFLKAEMMKSGRNPEYTYKCLHDNIPDNYLEIFTCVGNIQTPDWCPFLS